MSKLPFELLLALRYLRPKRSFVSIITLISVLGVMLGVTVLIIVISVMSGFDAELRAKVLGFTSHLKIAQLAAGQPGGEGTLSNYDAVEKLVQRHPEVVGVAPNVFGQVLLETQPVGGQALLRAPFVRGIDPSAEGTVSQLTNNMIAGSWEVERRGLVVGKRLADDLGLEVGDKVLILSERHLRKMRESERHGKTTEIPPDEYEIRGIFDAGLYEFNSLFVFTSLEQAQMLFGLFDNDEISNLTVAVRDPFRAATVARELQNELGPGYRVTTWMQDSPMMQAVAVEKNMMLYILFFIVLVAAFGITCTLITFIMMKTREIGLMKALGASRRQIMTVFLAQSLVVSGLGILAGFGLGILAISYRNEFLEFMRRATGAELFPAEIYGFTQLPALIMPVDLVVIGGGSLLICLAAAIFPAWHASRLNPVEALRHE
ncbi:MAG TPA: ABC transporter permease [Verrucomicrobiota bacterium]|nr:ABC transporter permease [Verrucomicrobiota bacterium]HNT14672.1 ABC transporter permease [Verrucomicrobiota bacterium]